MFLCTQQSKKWKALKGHSSLEVPCNFWIIWGMLMRLKEVFRAYELFLTFNTRNQTQEAQQAEGQIHLVCLFAFGKSVLGKGLFNFLWHPFQRECSSPLPPVCRAAKLAAEEEGLKHQHHSFHPAVDKSCLQSSFALLLSSTEGPRLSFFSCYLFLQSLGSPPTLPTCYTHTHICLQESLCA